MAPDCRHALRAGCPKGHVDDINWYRFVHGSEDNCRRQLWLDELGTSGDLATSLCAASAANGAAYMKRPSSS